MEYILTLLFTSILGLLAYVFKLKQSEKSLRRDNESKEFEVTAEKQKTKLAAKKAAIEGAKLGAQKAVDDFYSKYGDLINSTRKDGDEQ